MRICGSYKNFKNEIKILHTTSESALLAYDAKASRYASGALARRSLTAFSALLYMSDCRVTSTIHILLSDLVVGSDQVGEDLR